MFKFKSKFKKSIAKVLLVLLIVGSVTGIAHAAVAYDVSTYKVIRYNTSQGGSTTYYSGAMTVACAAGKSPVVTKETYSHSMSSSNYLDDYYSLTYTCK